MNKNMMIGFDLTNDLNFEFKILNLVKINY